MPTWRSLVVQVWYCFWVNFAGLDVMKVAHLVVMTAVGLALMKAAHLVVMPAADLAVMSVAH